MKRPIFLLLLSSLLLIYFSCSDDTDETTPAVEITAEFTADVTSINAGDSVHFMDETEGEPTSWSWTFEGGTPNTSSLQHPTVTYDTVGVFSVILSVSNGNAEDSITKVGYISVNGDGPTVAVVANFTADTTMVREGDIVRFTDSSTGNPTVWQWTFEGGNPMASADQFPTVTYDSAGTFEVTLIASNETENAADTLSKAAYITVVERDSTEELMAKFSVDRVNIQAGDSVRYTNRSTGAITSLQWTFEGGQPTVSDKVNPTVVYDSAGEYTVSLTVRNADEEDTETKDALITVTRVDIKKDEVNANFTVSKTNIQAGDSIQFTNRSTGRPSTLQWTFEGGTPATSNVANPKVVYDSAGVYAVSLTARNANSEDTETKASFINVREKSIATAPTAAFEADQTAIQVGDTIHFKDLSEGEPSTWQWHFDGGTPSTSAIPNPAIVYTTVGKYTVGLKVSNEKGEDEIEKEAYITVTNELSNQNELISFGFEAANNGGVISSEGEVKDGEVLVFLPFETDRTSLVPTFEISPLAKLSIEGQQLTSGTSEVDLTNEVTLTVAAEDGSENTFTLRLITHFDGLDNAIQGVMNSYNIPGVQLAIIKDEKLVYASSYGFADRESQAPVTNQSLFRIASVSKPITAVGILKLKDQGLLNLNDKVFGDDGILRNQFGTPPYSNDKQQVTVRHLLEHTSGWTNIPFDPLFSNISTSQAELIADMLDNRALEYSPGATYYYLNFGYMLLGRIIEAVSGMSYENYMQSNVLQASGVNAAMQIGGNTLGQRLPNEVKYYGQEGFSPYNLNIERLDAAGGWVASATDLVKILRRIDRNPDQPDILSQSSLNELYFGFFNWYIYGSLSGTSSVLSRVNNDFGFAVLANTRVIPDEEIQNRLLEVINAEVASRTEWPDYDLAD
ncbi:PKD domain-containing protein [Limibacter armeniacum]|uniref:serine hydrolase domain-containing protein n=1 Tax=Limibacter armeniacum TaxID=466084 RepID=UPI002FE6373E